MKKYVTFILLAAMIGMASCGSGGTKITNILAVPTGDSVSKGSYIQLTFNNTGNDSESFYIKDLTVNNSPVYAMSSTTTMNPADSFWTAKIELIDYTTKQIAMNLTATRDSSSPYGVYTVTTNNSTLTDYSLGQNKVYTIAATSTVTFTELSTGFAMGTLNLNLYYNYSVNVGTGSFQIFH